jgi:hypothetical protein
MTSLTLCLPGSGGGAGGAGVPDPVAIFVVCVQASSSSCGQEACPDVLLPTLANSAFSYCSSVRFECQGKFANIWSLGHHILAPALSGKLRNRGFGNTQPKIMNPAFTDCSLDFLSVLIYRSIVLQSAAQLWSQAL